MPLAIRLALIALYPLLLIGRVMFAIGGHDPLRRKEPAGSCWIERGPAPSARSYFSESDAAAPVTTAGAALGVVAGAFRPPDRRDGADAPATASLPGDIPDEVYTLW